MTGQGEMFSKSLKSKSRGRWTEDVLEKTIVKTLRQGLTALGIPHNEIRARVPCLHCGKNTWHVQPSEPGIPDLVGWVPPRLSPKGVAVPLYIEVKRPQGGVEGQVQKQFIERANRDRVIAMFARDWDTVADTLRAAGMKIPEDI